MWFSVNSLFLLFLCCDIAVEVVNSGNATHQEFILYGVNRQGKSIGRNNSQAYKNEKYLANMRDLEKISPMIRDGKMKSACVQVGLWAIFYGKHFTNIASILYASSDSNDRTCTQNKINETHYSSYQSIRYIGNADLSLPGLSLYKDKFFSGEELYFDGTILNLPTVLEFNSYGFTGKENWTLFSNQHFNGHAMCLASQNLKSDSEDADGGNKDRIIYNKIVRVPIRVGSILRGCIEQSNQTIVFPNGETSVQWTTKPKQLFEEDKNYTIYFKLYSEFEPDELVTDAKELRLPSTHSFPSYGFGPQNADSNNWTVFSGTEYNGHAKCFYTNNDTSIEDDDDESNTTATAENYIIVMGSIKEGCVDPITLPILEQRQLPKLEVEPTSDNPGNSLFFTSFIIGLIIFIIILIVAIFLILYFYFSNKRRRRRQ